LGIFDACQTCPASSLLHRDDDLQDVYAMSAGETAGDTEVLVRFPALANKAVVFNRPELNMILGLYGRYVADGEWRDYALDFGREIATFSIYRHASEQPLYRIVKNPALGRKQGMFSVVAQGGLIMKRGNDLEQVLRVLVKRPKLAGA
jgi:hypothetical protein